METPDEVLETYSEDNPDEWLLYQVLNLKP
jgi:hypothetical protein